MTQDERWNIRSKEVKAFIEANQKETQGRGCFMFH